MSTALYRRYRPETFAEVIGQSHVTDPLSAAIDSGRINHAYLFSGPRGCGKTTSARILARCLNCAEGPTSNPCGECPSCRDLANGGAGSLDVVEIDAASHNGVDDARDLRERAVYAPARDRYKVFILDEAHMVTTQGFNALLKLVEEPPDHVKFVFATTEPEKVIGTIRSRTHHYPFRLVPPEILTAYLEDLCGRESVPVGRGVLPLVVRAGGGSVRDTLSVLDQLMAGAGADGIDYETAVALLGYTHDSLLGDIVDAFSAGDGGGVFRVIDRVVESGHDPRRFVEDLLERFRDLIVIAAAPEEAASFLPEVPADRLERLRIQARSFGQAELSRAADLLNAGLSEMSGATSPRLHLELICARILLPAADGERRSVVSRVERMERRIGMSPTGVVPAGAVAPAPAEPSADQQAPAAERGGRGAASAAQGAGCAEPRGDQQSGRPSGGAPQRPGSTAQQAADPYDGMAEAMASAASVLSGGDSGRPASQPASPEAAAEPTAAEAQSSAPAQSQAPSQEAAPQRPSAPRQSSTPPSAPDGPSGAQPQPQQQPQPQAERAPAAGAAQAAPSDGAPQAAHSGGAEIDAIRRGWPDVLGRLQQLRRLSHAIVSANAFPQRFDAGVLYLGFSNPGSVQAFLRGPHAQMLSSALDDALGIAARIEVGDDSAGPIPDLGGERRGGRGADQPQRRQPPAPRQPSQQEMDAVVGPRQADRPPVDHERFWQSDDAPSGPWADDDAEGDSPSASVTPPDPGPAPAAAEPQRSGQAEDAQPVQDGAAQAGRDDAAQSVRDDAVPPVRDDAAQPVRDDSAPHAESETSAGEGAVDAYALMVPPPEDDDDDVVPVDDEWIPDGARGVGPEPAERAEFSGAPEDALDGYAEPTDPVAPADDDPQDAVDAPVGAGGPDADGAQPPQGAGQAAAVDDLLGAYADIDIAFTDNPGFEQPAAASDGPGQPDPRGRFAHIAERHRNDPDPTGGAATAPAPTPEPEPDPIENYAEYDTEGDLDLGEAPEFGPAVVERLLGGVIIEESRG